VDGQHGGAEQMIRNLTPGRPYRITVMAFSRVHAQVDLVMIVENVARHQLARIDATPSQCGRWLPVEAAFQAPREEVSGFRLGNAEGPIGYWDAVALEAGQVRLHTQVK